MKNICWEVQSRIVSGRKFNSCAKNEALCLLINKEIPKGHLYEASLPFETYAGEASLPISESLL
jgi:hypothetical protein